MEIAMEHITPEMATKYLANQIRNRPPSPALVRHYTSIYKAGKWSGQNGETIKFDAEGRLVDGQHRMLACAASGVAFDVLVVRGVMDVPTIDSGRRRTPGDVLSMNGIENGRTISGALRYLRTLESENPFTYHEMFTALEALDGYARHPGIAKSAELVLSLSMPKLASRSMLTALHYIFSSIDPGDADLFIRRLCTGENLHSKSPIHLLRERLLESMSIRHKRIVNSLKPAYIVKAWNLYRNGEDVEPNQIRIRRGKRAKGREKFPVAI